MVLRAVERARSRGVELPEGLSPHAFRRTVAPWLLSETGDVAYVQAALGHVDPSMTLGLYARALRSKSRRPHARRQPVEVPAFEHVVDAVAAEPVAA